MCRQIQCRPLSHRIPVRGAIQQSEWDGCADKHGRTHATGASTIAAATSRITRVASARRATARRANAANDAPNDAPDVLSLLEDIVRQLWGGCRMCEGHGWMCVCRERKMVVKDETFPNCKSTSGLTTTLLISKSKATALASRARCSSFPRGL